MTRKTVVVPVACEISPDMLPLRHEIKWADGSKTIPTARVFFANHRAGDRPFATISLDSRDAVEYTRDTARAKLICDAINAIAAAPSQPEAPAAEPEAAVVIETLRAQSSPAPSDDGEPVAWVGREELQLIRDGYQTVTATLWRTPIEGCSPVYTRSQSDGALLDALEHVRTLAKTGADKAGCDGWRAQEMCRQIGNFIARQALANAEGGE